MAVVVVVARVPEAARPAVMVAMPPVMIPVAAVVVAMFEPMAPMVASMTVVMLRTGARARGHQQAQAERRHPDEKLSSHGLPLLLLGTTPV